MFCVMCDIILRRIDLLLIHFHPVNNIGTLPFLLFSSFSTVPFGEDTASVAISIRGTGFAFGNLSGEFSPSSIYVCICVNSIQVTLSLGK